MVAKGCSMSHGQPVTGVRSAAMISIRREMSRDGVMVKIMAVGMGDRFGLSRREQRDSLVAFVLIKQATQRLAVRPLQFRSLIEDAQRLVARLGDELGMHLGTG